MKKYGFLLLFFAGNACGLGSLTVGNKTIGLLKVVIARGNDDAFFRVTVAQNEQFFQADLVDMGDKIDLKQGDTSGPLLPTVIVKTVYGRPANVTITCGSDQCDVKQE